ncbi:hypothetical protein Y032_0006g3035 [Ancylostoma ceylanicum]|uniref:Uncharacterized protein n=1 Tax=Ancylostoma ceylanicum TaxID=53326 RepID=A0A016VPT4_9BILA|nr:hypothetical protein Y032_0006g3035 [Ancylostoma ceylanicum]
MPAGMSCDADQSEVERQNDERFHLQIQFELFATTGKTTNNMRITAGRDSLDSLRAESAGRIRLVYLDDFAAESNTVGDGNKV